ncbi:hypothetical protein HUU51_00370 [Candidatus Gracilibacteria bacterium]|nr:hypothetical protein [Candidatus Gracilibacteria bacterium]
MDIFFQYLTAIGFGSFIGVLIKHFLDKDKEKMFFKLSFSREKHFLQKEKCFILLEKIDEVKNNLISMKIENTKNIENDLDKINKYWNDKDYINNLISIYIPELKIHTDKYTITYKNYESIIDLSRKLYGSNQESNEELFEIIGKFESQYFQYLVDLKESIENYLIKKEQNLLIKNSII